MGVPHVGGEVVGGRKKRRRQDWGRRWPICVVKVVPFPICLSCGVQRNFRSFIIFRVRPAVGAASMVSIRVARPERLNFMRGQLRVDGQEISLAAGLARFCQRYMFASVASQIIKADSIRSKTKLERRCRNQRGMPNLAGSVVQSACVRGLRPADLLLLRRGPPRPTRRLLDVTSIRQRSLYVDMLI